MQMKRLKELHADYRGEEWIENGITEEYNDALMCVATEKTVNEVTDIMETLIEFNNGERPDEEDDWIVYDPEKFNKVIKDANAVVFAKRDKATMEILDVLEGDPEEPTEEEKELAALDVLDGIDSPFYDPSAKDNGDWVRLFR